ncbi:M1 family metallopeptidase [Alkaliphilus transvaalensis]|uniref:M1 family metallopeptidase n=1 Tax=Alkaliphilus transvaalensis TaxID=114628 RepID=UPI000AB7C63E|nr:M1 family metallopeptidase [Alkaliphilus transvaalensis]
MKVSRRLKLLCIVFSVLSFTIGIQTVFDHPHIENVASRKTNENLLTQYKIEATFLEESMTIEAKQNIAFKNNMDIDFENIYFHIYPNAFRNKGQVPFDGDEREFAYPNGFNPGWIEIIEVKENNKRVYFKVMGEGETILRVSPQSSIKPGELREFTIEFEVKIPNVLARMGYGEHTVNITNWYPILAVYDQYGWNLDPYYSIGDPFYSEVANYEIIFNAPSNFVLASTGNMIDENKKNNMTTYRIKAEKVRDFAVILSKDFDLQQSNIDGITVKSYTIKGEKNKEALQVALDSVAIFNRIFGKYPYQQLSVVACDFFLGGMEYPNLVMIGSKLYEMEEDFPLEYVIAHEIAHQWWYGIVGNNEVKEPWLDEALTEYSTMLYFEEKYGEHIKEQILEKMIKAQYDNFLDLRSDRGEGILRSLKDFDDALEYSSIVYSKGALFIEELRKEMGEDEFRESIKEYYKMYQFKNATTLDFYNILEKNTDKDLRPIFEEWLHVKFE